jgi:hypothetical protein
METLFSPEEAATLERHIRPRVEAGGQPVRGSVAFLYARKVDAGTAKGDGDD